MQQKNDFLEHVSEYSFRLSITEIGLGGLLHGLHIPFAGQFLSLNQLFMLTLCIRSLEGNRYKNKAGFYTSNITALMKSLSPAGKKLGPMISISMQGLLYSLPIWALGFNRISTLLGFLLSAVWAFVQPFLTLVIYFGHDILNAFHFYLEKMQQTFETSHATLMGVLLIPVFIKLCLAVFVWHYSFKVDTDHSQKWIQFLLGKVKHKKKSYQSHSFFVGLKNDLTRPIFLISLLLTFSYLYFNRQYLAPTFWSYIRPFAFVVLIFCFNRLPWVRPWMEHHQHYSFIRVLKKVDDRLSKNIS